MSDTVQVGPFVLGERIGKGGMGVVHRALHEDTGEPVAVKVLLAEVAREPRKRRRFRREVQALAKLHHPAIAAVLDFGGLGPETAASGPESFAEGAPWFAMEYVDGRPLEEVVGGWGWREIEPFLQTTLDALAHAHARSIIHRDLKPSNILVDTSVPEAPEVQLVDFGIARVFESAREGDEEGPSTSVVGTPKYMAPEQILGQWRDEGPWTDLYALGCLVWWLVSGTPAFSGETTEEILEKHLRESPMSLDPRVALPAGFERWLRGLLRTKIDRRTQRAADAAWALQKLEGPEDVDSGSGSGAGEAVEETLRASPTLGGMEDTVREPVEPTVQTTGGEEKFDGESGPGGSVEAPGASPPPMLEEGRREAHAPTVAAVPKAGLELFALREIPVVDRESERDWLWRALRRTRETGRPRAVGLVGEPGTGKSRLAEWLNRRARETGAATTLRAMHSPASAPDEGLRGMVREAFRTTGLDRREVHERLIEQLPALEGEDALRLSDARALTEFLRPTGTADAVDGPAYEFSSPEQKYALIRRLFARLARDRPLVVWFDDLQWGRESIEVLARVLAEAGDGEPVLVVSTVRSDVVADDPQLRDRLDAIWEHEEASTIGIDPLTADDHRALVDRLLDLEPELADELAERTEGNPMFAIHLLRDWTDRGLLEVGDEGFRLPEGVEVEVSDDIHGLWLERLRRLVERIDRESPDRVWRALERAAALGREVDGREWRAVCEQVGLEAGDELRDALVERGLAVPTAGGWAFAHGLLIESIERRIRGEGRWAEHHGNCAELLEGMDLEHDIDRAGRRAEHWVEAGEFERAIEALHEQYEERYHRGHQRQALDALERREQLLDRIGAAPDDPRRIENEIDVCGRRRGLGEPAEEILETLRDARSRATARGDDRLIAKSWRVEAYVETTAGRYAEAVEAGRRATVFAERSGDQLEKVESLSNWGHAAFNLGDLDEAERRLREGFELANEIDTPHHHFAIQSRLGYLALTRGDDRRARELFEEMRETGRRAGIRTHESAALNGLGEIARFAGRADAAREHYQEYRRIALELSQGEAAIVASMNISQVEVMAREWERAARSLRRTERAMEDRAQKEDRIHLLRLTRMVRAIGVGEWERADEIWSRYDEGWPEDAPVLKDHPWLLEMAGDYADEAGERERAHRSWRLARTLWDRLADADAVERVEEKLER